MRPVNLLRDLLTAAVPSKWIESRGLLLDPWQKQVADSRDPLNLILCSRQSGKTTLVAAMVAHVLQTVAKALVLVLAPSERQSQELLLKAKGFLSFTSVAPLSLAKKTLELRNGSRAFALPGSEETVRGFSAPDLIVVDEAGMAPDPLYYAVRPMLATISERGRIILLTTPKGMRGFFYEEWTSELPARRTKVTGYDCPRIPREFLEAEKERMPDWLFRQEYLCEFVDNDLQVFGTSLIDAAFAAGATMPSLDMERTLNIPTNGAKALVL